VIRVPAKRILERLGFRVILARDGVEAVDQFRRHAGELVAVLLDLTMPNMNGADAFREMRRENPSIPVILMSGFSENGFHARFPDGETRGLPQKPFDVAPAGRCSPGLACGGRTRGARPPDGTSVMFSL
jgi:CheY-like chemotaxis protein